MIERVNLQIQQDSFNGFDIHNKHLIDVNQELEQQPIAISCGHKYNAHVPLVSYGDMCSIVGASKSMKSFYKTALVACYIGGKSQNYFEEIIGHDTEGKYIIDIDTEQSDYHVQKMAKRVLKMVGAEYPLYKPFAVRSLSPKERVQFLQWLFNESQYKGQIGLCALDQIADLVENVNDLEKSNEIINLLMKLTKENNVAMITVIHKNFDTLKPTGHLGSATLKKSETVLFTTIDERKTVKIEPKYTRNIPMDSLAFNINEEGIPQQSNDYLDIPF